MLAGRIPANILALTAYVFLSLSCCCSWVLGDLVCKLYHFVHSLSYTASIFILVVICTERYFAIIHPITCKQILTPRRLRVVMLCVWVLSALYSSPRFFWVQTISMPVDRIGNSETICISHRQKYDSETFDLVNFGLLYAAPLAVMLLLYTRIALVLWDAGRGPPGIHSSHRPRKEERRGSTPFCRGVGVAPTLRVTFDAARDNGTATPVDARVSIAAEEAGATAAAMDSDPTPTNGHGGGGGGPWNNNQLPVRKTTTRRSRGGGGGGAGASGARCYHVSASQNILKARRGVVRMLIVVVLTFAVCNLPYHARKMWQYWSTSYEGDSSFSTLFTPITFLLTYFNSGINPLLYAFLSRNFRKGMRELLLCPSREKGRPLAQQSSITRKTSVRSATKLCPGAAVGAGGAGVALEHSG
ncbi:Trissin receptor [Frankliniella fusca]|uniref:Trissin receptor n=1 Tax=Frankliniella fusca TaxID=407009 RepID=A0AAE1HDJ9_9NEOP|nr:Trissin receptor [Frankliniella fusca]